MNKNRLDGNYQIFKDRYMINLFSFSHRRSTDSSSQKTPIANISSNIPLMATSKDEGLRSSIQLLTNSLLETQSSVNSSNATTTSMKRKGTLDSYQSSEFYLKSI